MEHGLAAGSLRRAAATLFVGGGVKGESGSFASPTQRGLQCDPWKMCFVSSELRDTFTLGLHRSDGSPDKRLMDGLRHRMVGQRGTNQDGDLLFPLIRKEIQPKRTTGKQRSNLHRKL